MAAGLYALRGVEVAHEWPGGKMLSRMKYLISDYKPAPLPYTVSIGPVTYILWVFRLYAFYMLNE